MAITVTHSKVSTIPDGDDSSLIRPSDWNDDHVLDGTVPVANGGTGADTLTGYVKGNGTSAMTANSTIPNTDVTGLGTMSTQNANNVTITGGSISGTTVSGYIPTSEKAQALGVATLDAGGTVPLNQIPASIIGGLNYQGSWNASTNSPTLTSSTGTKGYYYVVSVAGTTNLDGITDWQVGDLAVFNGTVWQKIDNTDAVTSVNGYTGTVVLTTTDIAEGTNLYYTDARARGALSAGTGISYNSTTGVITNSSPSLGGDVVGPSSATDNAIARFDTTTGKLIQNSVVTVSDAGQIAGATSILNTNYVDFDTTYATTLTEGQLGWDGNNTLGIGMAGGNVTQHIGEDQFFYCKASSAITKGQVVMFTGAVGASGVLTGAPATGITDGTYIMGIAAEAIATNGFGLIQSFGTLRNVDTSNPFVALPFPGDHINYGTLEITFKVDEDLENYLELHNWLKALGKPQNYEQYREIEQKPIYTGEGIVSDISITILSSTKLANYEVIYVDAFPVSLSGINFNTVDTDVNYLEASATFKYTYYNIEKIP